MGDLFVTVNGVQYVNVDKLIEQMVKVCVAHTDTDDVVVYEGETELVNAYQTLTHCFPGSGMSIKFHDRYVSERFDHRTIGV